MFRHITVCAAASRPEENHIPMDVPLECLSHPFKAARRVGRIVCEAGKKRCFQGSEVTTDSKLAVAIRRSDSK